MSQIVAEVKADAARSGRIDVNPDPGAWPLPIEDGDWTDEAGAYWRKRGDLIDIRKMKRLLNRGDVTGLHVDEHADRRR